MRARRARNPTTSRRRVVGGPRGTSALASRCDSWRRASSLVSSDRFPRCSGPPFRASVPRLRARSERAVAARLRADLGDRAPLGPPPLRRRICGASLLALAVLELAANYVLAARLLLVVGFAAFFNQRLGELLEPRTGYARGVLFILLDAITWAG